MTTLIRSLLILPVAIALTATCAEALDSAEMSDVERRMVSFVNEERRKAGLDPLTTDSQLANIARAHSREMRDEDRIFHDSPTTGAPGDRLRSAGYSYRVVLENVAYDPVIEDAHTGLMQSPGHRRNILSNEVTRIGIGIVELPRTGRGPLYFITQLFAHPVTTRSSTASLSAVETVMQKARVTSNLPPLTRPDSLDALVKRSLSSVSDPLASDALDRLWQRVRRDLDRVDGGRWRKSELSLQVIADADDWRIPDAVRRQNLNAAGVATLMTTDSKGMPQLVVLLLLTGQ